MARALTRCCCSTCDAAVICQCAAPQEAADVSIYRHFRALSALLPALPRAASCEDTACYLLIISLHLLLIIDDALILSIIFMLMTAARSSSRQT